MRFTLFQMLRTFIGKVVSDRNDKTIAVEVTQYYKHPKYPKLIKTSKKFQTHDERMSNDKIYISTQHTYLSHRLHTIHNTTFFLLSSHPIRQILWMKLLAIPIIPSAVLL